MPWVIAAVAAAGLVVLHLLGRRRPPAAVLPTARFLPAGPLPARSRRWHPSHLGLFALRLAALVAAAAALDPRGRLAPRAGMARVVVVDASRAIGSVATRTDSVRAWLADGAATELIAFDSTVVSVSAEEVSSLGAGGGPGVLGAALLHALRRANQLAARHRAVEVVVVSPVVEEEWSEAIPELVRLGGRPVRWVRLPPAVAATDTAAVGTLPDMQSVVGALGWNALGRPRPGLRLVEGSPDAADSAWAVNGGTVLAFPAPVETFPANDAVYVEGRAAVGAWQRAPVPEGRAIAWWGDGEVAATERPMGRGCIRNAGLALPTRGDEALRPSLAAVVRHLATPCGAPRLGPVHDTLLRATALTDTRRAPGAAMASVASSPPPDRRWRLLLFALALIALGGEWWWRRRVA